jgi:hypothetical protein
MENLPKPAIAGDNATTPKPYWEMTTAELREATAEFDREFVGETFGPLSPAQCAEWARMKRRGPNPGP